MRRMRDKGRVAGGVWPCADMASVVAVGFHFPKAFLLRFLASKNEGHSGKRKLAISIRKHNKR